MNICRFSVGVQNLFCRGSQPVVRVPRGGKWNALRSTHRTYVSTRQATLPRSRSPQKCYLLKGYGFWKSFITLLSRERQQSGWHSVVSRFSPLRLTLYPARSGNVCQSLHCSVVYSLTFRWPLYVFSYGRSKAYVGNCPWRWMFILCVAWLRTISQATSSPPVHTTVTVNMLSLSYHIQ